MGTHKVFMYAVFTTSCISLVFYVASISTNTWIKASATYFDLDSKETINYGLFSGNVIRQVLSMTFQYDLTVTCDFSENACFYSCQDDPDERELELKRILKGEDLYPCATPKSGTKSSKFFAHSRYKIQSSPFNPMHLHSGNRKTKSFAKDCIPAAYWLCTLLFFVIAAFFTATSAVFSLVNVSYRPAEPIWNVYGLYIWNTIAAVSSVVALALWVTLFFQYLLVNIAISDTLNIEVTFVSQDKVSIGSSFYLGIVGLFFNLTNIFCLVLRNYLIKKDAEPQTLTIEEDDRPLQFY